VYGKNNHRFIVKILFVWYNIGDVLSGDTRFPATERKMDAMNYDFSRMGENIAALRRVAGMTQEMLADRLGVTSQAVSKWERQLSCPDVSLLPAVAEVFGVGIDELFAGASADTVPSIDALPWEEDGRVRIAVFEGKRLCTHEVYECPDGEEMVLLIRHEGGRHALPFGMVKPVGKNKTTPE
jgi:transcriptional regulator with XRE-family HTH domain